MAGVDPNAGQTAETQTVAAIGGAEPRDIIAKTAHVSDANRSEGVAYPEEWGTGPDGKGYPAGTSFPEGGINDAPGIH